MSVRTYAQQKAALTRKLKAAKAGHEEERNALVEECRRTVREWDSREGQFSYGWPDDWARWQRALDDVFPWSRSVLLEDLTR